MVLYDAISGDDVHREAVVDAIEKIKGGNIDGLESASNALDVDSGVRRVNRILIRLGRLKLDAILDYLLQAAAEDPFKGTLEGVVLNRFVSERWKRRYEADSVYDLVLFLPHWARTVALSTTEVDLQEAETLQLLAKVNLKNFQTYFAFNRAHGVRGRSVTVSKESDNPLSDSMGSMIRSCKAAEDIARGFNLRRYTPINTENGLRLGFFFTLEGLVTEAAAPRSSGGIGYDLGQTQLVLDDGTGKTTVRINNHVFVDAKVSGWIPESLLDPVGLKGRAAVVVGVRFLGAQLSYCTYVAVRESVDEGAPALGYMNSVKKASKASTLLLPQRPNFLAITDEWVYYKEPSWPPEVFKLMVSKRFGEVRLGDILSAGLEAGWTRGWVSSIREYLETNDDTATLYLSDNPLQDFGVPFEFKAVDFDRDELLRGETIEERPIPTLVHLTRWSDVLAAYPKLRATAYDVSEVFGWDNGGYKTEIFWRRLGKMRNSPDKLLSALHFIMQGRGAVNVPA
nr:hypothetical protein [Ferrimicrobium acidiphilum]